MHTKKIKISLTTEGPTRADLWDLQSGPFAHLNLVFLRIDGRKEECPFSNFWIVRLVLY